MLRANNALRLEIEAQPYGVSAVVYHIMGDVPADSQVWMPDLRSRLEALDGVGDVFDGIEAHDDAFLSVTWTQAVGTAEQLASLLASVTLHIQGFLQELTGVDARQIQVEQVPFRGDL